MMTTAETVVMEMTEKAVADCGSDGSRQWQ
jgi:hypothetical protein